MEQVFITGRGIVSPIGNTVPVNERSLREGTSGVKTCDSFVEAGLSTTIAGVCSYEPDPELLDRKTMRFCAPSAAMSVLAVKEALAEAGLTPDDVRGKRIAIIAGVPDSSSIETFNNANNFMKRDHKVNAVSPLAVPRVMPSNVVSIISMVFGINGESFCVSAACASSAVAVMIGMRMIHSGIYDIVLAGGAEYADWVLTLGFCACRALSTKYNGTPELASRPFDTDRDGFVIASGASFMVLESEKSMLARGAKPICRISGAASNSNATDMVQPSVPGCVDVMREAIANAGLKPEDIDYVNTHGTSTPIGDPIEMAAIKEVMGSRPAINSTKSQTGHMIGATGAAEVIFTSIMMDRNFISRNVNLEHPDAEFGWADLVRECREGVNIKHALSNSFAFGGTNCAIVLSK